MESLPARNDDSYISLFVQDMSVNVRVGIYPEERTAPQRLLVSAELFTGHEYLQGAVPETLIDYAEIAAAIRAWEGREHTELLETLMQDLLAVCFTDKRVMACRAAIAKPDIIREARQAGIRVYMTRKEYEQNR